MVFDWERKVRERTTRGRKRWLGKSSEARKRRWKVIRRWDKKWRQEVKGSSEGQAKVLFWTVSYLERKINLITKYLCWIYIWLNFRLGIYYLKYVKNNYFIDSKMKRQPHKMIWLSIMAKIYISFWEVWECVRAEERFGMFWLFHKSSANVID